MRKLSIRGYLLFSGYVAALMTIGKYLVYYTHLDSWERFRWFAETVVYRITGASL